MAEQRIFAELLGQAVSDPRGAYRRVLGMGLARRPMWGLLLRFTIFRVLLIGISDNGLFIRPLGTPPILSGPLPVAAVPWNGASPIARST